MKSQTNLLELAHLPPIPGEAVDGSSGTFKGIKRDSFPTLRAIVIPPVRWRLPRRPPPSRLAASRRRMSKRGKEMPSAPLRKAKHLPPRTKLPGNLPVHYSHETLFRQVLERMATGRRPRSSSPTPTKG